MCHHGCREQMFSVPHAVGHSKSTAVRRGWGELSGSVSAGCRPLSVSKDREGRAPE